MKSTGVVRKLDDLGRIVIPIELRRTMDIGLRDTLEIFVEDDKIILKKYHPACIFCNDARDVVRYKDKLICKKCLEQLKKEVPSFGVGDTVRVHNRITEGDKSRVQIYEGTVIKKQGGSNRATFTVRKISNGIGVEKTWPLHSPNVAKIEVVRHGKVRRAKLNYLRERTGKSARVKEIIK